MSAESEVEREEDETARKKWRTPAAVRFNLTTFVPLLQWLSSAFGPVRDSIAFLGSNLSGSLFGSLLVIAFLFNMLQLTVECAREFRLPGRGEVTSRALWPLDTMVYGLLGIVTDTFTQSHSYVAHVALIVKGLHLWIQGNSAAVLSIQRDLSKKGK